MTFSEPIPVALAKCSNYGKKDLSQVIPKLMDAAGLDISYGTRVLLKPNLLMKKPLACTSPQVISILAAYLLDLGAKVTIADSPGFGSVKAISQAIGLENELEKLGLEVIALRGTRKLYFQINGKKVTLSISPLVFDQDRILSVCRVKAHSQMRLTLSVKNCFGVIPGLHKAFIHTLYGETTEFFAACIAALYKMLPPVNGFADGIIAMHVTGPSKGEPYPLGLLGASRNAAALDEAIIKILDRSISEIPLAQALALNSEPSHLTFPLLKTEDFSAQGFILPEDLKAASFNPWRLAKSCVKRIWRGFVN